jgi:hypothetical protein
MDRITEFTGKGFKIKSTIPLNIEYYVIGLIRSPIEMQVELRIKDGIIGLTESDIIQNRTWKLDGANRFLGKWIGNGVANCEIEYSKYSSYNKIPPSWLYLTQEPDAPVFSWEGRGSTFGEVRFPNIMMLTLSPKIKCVETEKHTLLQLRAGSQSGFAVLQREIATNSWRTITCAFLASSGQGVLYSFGPLKVNLIGKHIEFKWNSATLDASHTFENIIELDATTFYLAVVQMQSDLENIYPNRVTFYIASFSYWIADRQNKSTFSTNKMESIYNISDSAQLILGDSINSCNAAISWIRLFDYELTHSDIIRDLNNYWL